MNVDEILYQQLLANEGKTRTTEAIYLEWESFIEDVKANPHVHNYEQLCFIYKEVTVYSVITYREHIQERSYHELKADQEATRKRAQLGRERFQEFKSEGLNPTISAALACLAEQIGMEKIKEAMAQAEKQVKGKK